MSFERIRSQAFLSPVTSCVGCGYEDEFDMISKNARPPASRMSGVPVGRSAETMRFGCSIEVAHYALGGRWTVRLIMLLSDGPQRFSALRAKLPGISAKVLTSRLRSLFEMGIIEGAPISGSMVNAYALTAWGKELTPVYAAIRAWVSSPQRPPGAGQARRR
jgi:DNA-binding HxlR family transcriptional regulator